MSVRGGAGAGASGEALEVKDVLIGEVWLASGQSNMAMTVGNSKNADQEKAAARYPQIRMFKVALDPTDKPKNDCKGQWMVCAPETVAGFSATAYFFGRELHKSLKVPVGLINTSVGGTPIEAWTSWDAQEKEPKLADMLDRGRNAVASYDPEADQKRYEKAKAAHREAAKKAKAEGTRAPRAPEPAKPPQFRQGHPASLFNGMVAPLTSYAIRGAIWYQGEANSSTIARGELYGAQLPLMVQDWRTRWGQGDFPFLWVQLPNFLAKQPETEPTANADRNGRSFPAVRESMLKALKIVPNSGMAVTIDIGEADDIHPKNKQDVGKRLAAWALVKTYNKSGAASGPLPLRHKIAGREIVIEFEHADGGLKTSDGSAVKGFAIGGRDRQWRVADARIVGNTIVLSHPDVDEPIAARHAWANNPNCNLINSEGLPASPFRTDEKSLAGRP